MSDNTLLARLANARKRLEDLRDGIGLTPADTPEVRAHDMQVWQTQINILEQLRREEQTNGH